MKSISPTSRFRTVTALVVGLFASIASIVHVAQEPAGDPRNVIQQTETLIAAEASPYNALFDGAKQQELWTSLQSKWSRLSDTNQKIARSRALVRLNTNPNLAQTADWHERNHWAAQSWIYAEWYDRPLRYLLFGAFSFIAATLGIWVFGLLVSWLWYFVLDRVSELFHAIRGNT